MSGNGQRPIPRLKKKYLEEVRPSLQKKLNLTNIMQVPRLEKIVVNIGVGEGVTDPKKIDGAMQDLAVITGQKPKLNRAKKSIAGFKLRKGMPVGVSVTLRGDRMWEFFDRTVTLAIPRVRDFRGMPLSSFDGRGNYSFGFTEQLVYPEIDYDKIDAVRGMDVTIVTTADNDDHAYELLSSLGFPFKQKER
ncbi:MAG: 50S ribosomal protein L5 [Acidimicrobiia bacterium]